MKKMVIDINSMKKISIDINYMKKILMSVNFIENHFFLKKNISFVGVIISVICANAYLSI